ncbi:hypothetical protein K445DRAFT_322426 [Daldinia sp. EC12]|nr:hypothetical protein K445DRAFT_322426 [Daldinia sp. EC12]
MILDIELSNLKVATTRPRNMEMGDDSLGTEDAIRQAEVRGQYGGNAGCRLQVATKTHEK